MKSRLLCFFLMSGLLPLPMAYAQFVGKPFVINYDKRTYRGDNQNWSVAVGQNGLIYFGNDKGLLEFDGSNWNLHQMPDNGIVRSVTVGDDNNIYVGSYQEFGYWNRDNCGVLSYTSLSKKLLAPNALHNDEIRRIPDRNRDFLLQSTYSAFAIYTSVNNTWKLAHSVSGFYEPISNYEIDHLGNIWCAHATRGIFRIRLKPDYNSVESTAIYGKEKLEADVNFKNIQLADFTMSVIKRNEQLIRIRDEFMRQSGDKGSAFFRAFQEKIIRLFDKQLSSDDDWQTFETHFDQAHQDYLNRLKSAFPLLTQSDLKLCAYLRLNISSKEIAHLLNI